MHQIIFYPVGNGDTSQIILNNGKRILFDFRHLKKAEDGKGPEIDLKARLKEELQGCKRTSFDVVAFTHGDADHIENSTELFELLHAKKYQGNGRIKIDELWVPAAMILETATTDEQSAEFVIWRQEARYRLKEGKDIRIFSKPDKLKEWLEENNLTVDSRRHLITDAGKLCRDLLSQEMGLNSSAIPPLSSMLTIAMIYEMEQPSCLMFDSKLDPTPSTILRLETPNGKS